MGRHLLLLLCLLASACASRSLTPWLAQRPLQGQGGIVLWTKLDDQGELKGKYSCTLILKGPQGKEKRVPVKAGKSRHILMGEVGTYGLKGVECGLFTDFGLEMSPRFALVADHFSWVGELALTLTDRRTLKWGFERPDPTEMKVEYLALPEQVRQQLISGYSAVKLEEDFFKKRAENIEIEARGLLRPLSSQSVTFPGCFEVEAQINPLKIGQLSFTKKGVAPFTRSGAHAYTPALVKCLEEGLSSLPADHFNQESSLTIHY